MMGAIKEFFHDEICEMQVNESFEIDDDYMEAKWQRHLDEAAISALKDMEDDLSEINKSDVPRHFHPKF